MPGQTTLLFNGFSGETLNFLSSLGANNNRAWFEANKHRCQESLLQPLKNLVSSLGPLMQSIDPHLEISPGRAVSRIYRDTRFSRDKSPYKTNMWISFKRPSKDWKQDPVFFFDLFPDWYRYGMQTMDKLRVMIDTRPREFLRAISFYPEQSIFKLEGET